MLEKIMSHCRYEKPYLVVNKEELFIYLIEKYLSDKGFVLLNTCPLSLEINSAETQRNSENCRSAVTKSLRRRKRT